MANKVKQFLTEAKAELKKVSWPTVADVKASTIVVLVTTFLLAFFIGIVDFVVSKIITFLIK